MCDCSEDLRYIFEIHRDKIEGAIYDVSKKLLSELDVMNIYTKNAEHESYKNLCKMTVDRIRDAIRMIEFDDVKSHVNNYREIEERYRCCKVELHDMTSDSCTEKSQDVTE